MFCAHTGVDFIGISPIHIKVCEEAGCGPGAYPLAMQLLRKYLLVTPVDHGSGRLLGAACLLVASKYSDVTPPSCDSLLCFLGNSFNRGDLLVSAEGIC